MNYLQEYSNRQKTIDNVIAEKAMHGHMPTHVKHAPPTDTFGWVPVDWKNASTLRSIHFSDGTIYNVAPSEKSMEATKKTVILDESIFTEEALKQAEDELAKWAESEKSEAIKGAELSTQVDSSKFPSDIAAAIAAKAIGG